MDKESESEHWYDKNRRSCVYIVGSNGKERNTNLKDARKHGYVPSVTTILGVAAKTIFRELENKSGSELCTYIKEDKMMKSRLNSFTDVRSIQRV